MEINSEYQLSNNNIPIYMRVYEHYKELILTEKLSFGSKMPSIRRCATELSISRTTAETAYLQLAADGYIISKPRSGYFVTDIIPKNQKTSNNYSEPDPKIDYDFSSLSVDPESFDFNLWRRYIKSALRQDEKLISYGQVQGELELREAICKYIKDRRNAVCSPNNIVIGAGVQSLLHILCTIFKDKSKISFQDSSFYQGIAIFKDHGYTLVDDKNDSDIFYISPSHINKWGDIMQTKERLELIHWSRSNNITIIEDDYDNEFSYFNKKVPSLQGLDGGTNVVYIGTFSKLLLPSIRISFMILPNNLIESYTKICNLYNQTASKTEQIALCQFIRDGHLSSRIKKIKKIYLQKIKRLAQEIELVFGKDTPYYIGESGFIIRLDIKTTKAEEELVSLAKESSILIKTAGRTDDYTHILLSCFCVQECDYNFVLRKLKTILTEDGENVVNI